jgi:hypothetical protein
MTETSDTPTRDDLIVLGGLERRSHLISEPRAGELAGQKTCHHLVLAARPQDLHVRSASELLYPSAQEAPLGLRGSQFERMPVLGDRVGVVASAAQQIGAGR